ncbi:FAD-dependent oxidoreductase [Gluconacetobacter azotocaptans]|uniref:FAD-dependent oxidoreductase n=1 Tax=Gluconacetobacter azotocaptans TaxID=142834 RepID=A0A7W4JPD3_9PROT|nr:FAD-dependent oxidoreductase [Gluconacetobacter azotocaptans]
MWHDIVAFDELSANEPRRIEIDGKPLVVLKEGGRIHALSAKCPHKGAPLEKGAVCDGTLVCPWHKAIFSVVDGRLMEPPALDPLESFPVEVRDGRVLIQYRPKAIGPTSSEVRRMPSEAESVVIVGAGAAGTTTAVSLREFGFGGPIALIDPEKRAPYDRTALSKTVLAGKSEGNAPPALLPADRMSEDRITRITERVVALDPETRSVTLSDSRVVMGRHLVLAPGAHPVRLPVEGAGLKGVHSLRTADDAQHILEGVSPDGHAVIVGGSFIAMEAAAALRQRGTRVSVVSRDKVPFCTAFGTRVGESLLRLHLDHGVAWHGGREVARIEQQAGALAVSLDDGRKLDADIVLIGVGVRPATGFVPALTEEDGGIDVDAALQAKPGIYVAGDCARLEHAGRRSRIEHWRTAEVLGRRVARTIMGQPISAATVPWFWTQQFGKKIEYAGFHQPFDHIVVDGDVDAFDFTARHYRDNRYVGIVSAGRPGVTAHVVGTGQLT